MRALLGFSVKMTMSLLLVLLFADELKKRLLFHTSYKLYLASLSLAVFYLFIMCIVYGKYANDGIRDELFRTFGNCLCLKTVCINYLLS